MGFFLGSLAVALH